MSEANYGQTTLYIISLRSWCTQTTRFQA